MDVEGLILDFQYQLRENGYDTKRDITFNEDGEVVEMKFRVTGRLD
jgi:hypothetical protein